jgi:hypothetical protein
MSVLHIHDIIDTRILDLFHTSFTSPQIEYFYHYYTKKSKISSSIFMLLTLIIAQFHQTADFIVLQNSSAVHAVAVQFNDKSNSSNDTAKFFDHLALAMAVPPVASRSSTIRTLCPGLMASLCMNTSLEPYSRSYLQEIVSRGSFPGFLTGAKPTPILTATGASEDKAAALRSNDNISIDFLAEGRS